MKNELLQLIKCPDCGGGICIDYVDVYKDEIINGTLICEACQGIFHIEEGIPRLLPLTLSSKIETGRTSNHDESILGILDNKIKEIQIRDCEANQYLKFFKGNETEIESRNVVDLLNINKRTKILDMGAGTGRITEKYASKSHLTIACDYSFQSLVEFKNRFKSSSVNINFVQADGTASPFRDAVFDRVLASGIFMHIYGDEMRNRFLHESNRVLGNEGLFVITGKNYSYFDWRMGKEKEEFSRSGIYMHYTPKKKFIDLLKKYYIVDRCFGFRHEIPIVTRYVGQPLILDHLLQYVPGSEYFAESFIALCSKRNFKL